MLISIVTFTTLINLSIADQTFTRKLTDILKVDIIDTIPTSGEAECVLSCERSAACYRSATHATHGSRKECYHLRNITASSYVIVSAGKQAVQVFLYEVLQGQYTKTVCSKYSCLLLTNIAVPYIYFTQVLCIPLLKNRSRSSIKYFLQDLVFGHLNSFCCFPQ